MDIGKIRKQFPILNRKVNGKTLVYFDNAATSQKPLPVLAAMQNYYLQKNANIHRGIHQLSVEATQAYEQSRKKIAEFVGVDDSSEIIFTKNATEAINLVAYSWGRINIGKGDEIVLTIAEHHSNFVPWQQLALENGAVLKVVPVDEKGELEIKAFENAITKKTKLVTFCHVSNVLGTINPVRELITMIRGLTPKVSILVDGAQAVPHMKVDIDSLGCDFYVFTGHKMMGPTGIGVLWGGRQLLEVMPPFLFGGDMISKVTLGKTTWNQLPWKFEAGTPNIEAAIGLGAACDFLEKIGMDNVRKHEMELTDYALKKLSELVGVTVYGPTYSQKRGGVISFNMVSSLSHLADRTVNNFYSSSEAKRNREVTFIHPHDVASIFDEQGIAIRSGHHCAQPLMDFYGVDSMCRASFNIYNTKEEIDRMMVAVKKVKETFKI